MNIELLILFSYYPLISVRSEVMFLFSSLILVICVFSIFFLIILAKDYSLLFFFSKEWLLSLLVIPIVSPFTVSVISTLIIVYHSFCSL